MEFTLIDTHCHPQFPQYDTDREAMLQRAMDARIGMLCVGTDLETSRSALMLAETHEGIWASAGIHPNETDESLPAGFVEMLSHPKLVAIGEVGLDYYRTPEPQAQNKQREMLDTFLVFAKEHQKPIIIHCRDAYDDLLSLALPPGVVHSFTGTVGQAEAFIDRGMYIGLNGIVTFSAEYDDMVRAVPLERLLLETDSPYLAPPPNRGKRNEPAYITEIARHIAKIKDFPVESVMEITTKNAKSLFKI